MRDVVLLVVILPHKMRKPAFILVTSTETVIRQKRISETTMTCYDRV